MHNKPLAESPVANIADSLPSDQLRRILYYFDGLSPQQTSQLEHIAPLYADWNERLNLVSRKDIDHIYLKHVLHALSIGKVVQFQPGTRVLDVGTGGGFPGIPLAILFPATQFHLVDSIGKKVKAVQCIIQALGLQNATAEQIRVENLTEKYDFVTGRAVTKLNTFTAWVENNIADESKHACPNGIFYLKGDEPVHTSWHYRSYAISDFFQEAFFSTKQLVHLYQF